MTTHSMTPVDAAWLHMEGPVNLAIMTGVILTRKPLDFERVRAIYRARLPQFERFSQRVVELGFPIAMPHWQVHVVDDGAGGSALVMRVHHCIADGTGMMTVTRQLFDTEAEAPVIPRPAAAPPASPAGNGLLAPALLTIASKAVHAVTHPREALAQAVTVLQGAGMLMGDMLKADDPPFPLKGAFGLQKRVAWSATIPIKEVKAIGARFGAKVNDVLAATMAGALRAYLQGGGVEVNHTTLAVST